MAASLSPRVASPGKGTKGPAASLGIQHLALLGSEQMGPLAFGDIILLAKQ